MDCIKTIRRRNIFVVIYTFTLALNIPFGTLSAVCLYYLFTRYDKDQLALFLLIWGLEVFFLTTCLVFRTILNRSGADKSTVAPYIISTDINSYNELIKKRFGNLCLMDNCYGGYYSFEKRKKSFLCIINYMDEYKIDAFKAIIKKSTEYTRKKSGLNNKGSLQTIRSNIRIYINVFYSLDDSIKTIIESNAFFGTAKAESTVSIFWEIKTGNLYIPAYNSKWYGGSRAYGDAINYLLKKGVI